VHLRGGRTKDLEAKKAELADIVAETEKEEKELMKASEKATEGIEERLVNAYKRVRANTRNGLAVVPVERDACGGCFNKIPPQKQLDIKMNKKILVWICLWILECIFCKRFELICF